ncbi:MAG TPA: CBS domain-containing protein [Acidimicrobiia bacterium]|nr:CBS domain-containing protein [Acidimicrobiia bacterium]
MAVADDLATMAVSELDLGRFVKVAPTQSISETVEAMRDTGYSCACVVDDETLVGVFTQRDVLMRVLGRSRLCDDPVGDEMTRSPRTMRPDQSVAYGLAIMREWWVRSVPVVDSAGGLVGNFSWYTVMSTMAGILNRPSEPGQTGPGVEHGLEFVDFTGLNISTPVTVYEQDTADVAAHHMRARAIGSILVVDQREHLTGIISEFDLLVKLACTGAELEKVTVGEMMSPDVVTLSVRSKISDAIQKMADNGFSHAPLLGESSRPVGVASFRDIAAYFERSLETFV